MSTAAVQVEPTGKSGIIPDLSGFQPNRVDKEGSFERYTDTLYYNDTTKRDRAPREESPV